MGSIIPNRCVFALFLVGTLLTNLHRALKKQVICIFCINVVVFDIVFYSQGALRPCIISGYAAKKLRKNHNNEYLTGRLLAL